VTVDLVTLADDAAIAKAYVVGMVVPLEQPEKQDGASNNSEALFGISFNGYATVPATTDE
jgi:hypothetical protein